MAEIYDYEDAQPGDMPYDQAEQASYDRLSALYDVCVINSWCKRDRDHRGECAPVRGTW